MLKADEWVLPRLMRRELRKISGAVVALVLVVGLGLASAGGSGIRGFCEAADLSITAVGEMPEDGQEFSLAINSTAGGSVTTPGEGGFVYDEGTVVDLVATPEEGYEFLSWAGDVDTIGNVDAAETTITVDDRYSIVARFDRTPEVVNELRSPVSWALVSGIVAVAVVAGLTIFFVRRRKSTETTRR